MSSAASHEAERYIGLMSGTSLDGVDAVLAEFPPGLPARLLKTHYLPYSDALRERLLALHASQTDEIDLAARAANELAELYAGAVNALCIDQARVSVRAIGCHGQTLRHQPARGYTVQIGNAALLAERTGISVVADFRSRDIAAGGQGAPLVPAFHAHVLGDASRHRVIANVGGIANVTDLPPGGLVRGWDTGPGNMLMDAWVQRHRQLRYDPDGSWASSGDVNPELLARLLAHPYLAAPPPKSAGREQFNLDGLDALLAQYPPIPPEDVQASLLEFTAASLADAIESECQAAQEIYVCGGGAHNSRLMARLAERLPGRRVATTSTLGLDPDWVEAMAFAWLAHQTLHRQPGNLPAVTGARGPRILGAIYPA